MNYRKKLIWLIISGTLARILLSTFTELGNVEAYYWSWSIRPQWNYVDHPPVVAWVLYLTTLGQHMINEVTVRLTAIISSAICTWLMFKTGTLLQDERSGWYAALCYTCCIYSSVAVGIFVLPDSVQLIFWLASLYILLKLPAASNSKEHIKTWLYFGLLAGLCMMSKVHGVFIWFGAILYILIEDRKQFKLPGIYLAALVTAVVFSPFVIWNIQHDWYTWHFQSARFNITGHGAHLLRFLKQQVEIVLLIGPIVTFLIGRGLFFCLRDKTISKDKRIRILLYCNVPLIIFLFVVSVFREVYIHWPGPGYVGLLLLPALIKRSAKSGTSSSLPAIYRWALAYCFFIATTQAISINLLPGTTSVHTSGLETGKGDLTTDFVGWTNTGMQFDSLYKDDIKKKRIKEGTPILVTNWTPASATEFYVARKTGQRVLAISCLDSLHQYYWMNSYKKPLVKGDDAYYIIPSNHFELSVVSQVTQHFEKAENVLTVPAYRMDRLCRQFYIFRLRTYDGRKFY